jgi:hypothetical protein
VTRIATKLILDTMRTSLALATAVLRTGAFVTIGMTVACASASVSRFATNVPVEQQGRYVFQESVAGSSRTLVLEGEFTVQADTVTVTERSARCDPAQPPDLRHFVVRCGDLTLLFDRRFPSRHVAYRVDGYKLVEESGCIGRRVATGNEVACDRTATDEREVRGPLTGVLRNVRHVDRAADRAVDRGVNRQR